MRHSRKREATLQVYVKVAYELVKVIALALRYWNRFLQDVSPEAYGDRRHATRQRG
jgi:hypothetical protein